MDKTSKKAGASNLKSHDREKGYLYLIARCYVVFILAVYPLYVGFEGYDNIIFSKAQLFWPVSLIFLVAFMLFYLAHWLGLSKDAKPQRWWKSMSLPDWAALCFLAVITLSCIFSPYRDMVFLGMLNRNDGWLTYFCMIMSYFVISRWYKPRYADFALFAASSIIICVICYLQLYGMDFLSLYPHYFSKEGVRIATGFSIVFRSTIGNIDFVGTYVSITVVVFGILYVKAKGPLRFLFLAASVMNFIYSVIGDSDAGKVGILGAMVLLIPYWVYRRESCGRVLVLSSLWGIAYAFHHWFVLNMVIPSWPEDIPQGGRAWDASMNALPLIKPVLIISIAALAAGAVLLLLKSSAWPGEKTARILGVSLLILMIAGGLLMVEIAGEKAPEGNIIHEAREVMHGRMRDEFGSMRGYVWRKSIEAFPSQPFLGTGQDTFIRAFGKINQSESRDTLGVYYDKAHNDFIQILMCNGILGLISYLAFCAGIVVLSVRRAFNDVFLLVALGGVLAYLGQSLFGIDTLTVTPIYWLLLAVVRGRYGDKQEVEA